MFEFDLDLPFVLFALYVECALNQLTPKESNTVKIKFHVLQPEYLRDIDYYADEEHQKKILHTFKKKMKENHLLTNISGFIFDHPEEYDAFGPNGYSAIYSYLMEEGL